MSGYEGASERIVATVTAWPGVEAVTGSRGELSLRVGRREIGHLHGDHAAHFGLPKALFHELHDRGAIDFHPVFPGKPGFGDRDRGRRERGDRDPRPQLRPGDRAPRTAG